MQSISFYVRRIGIPFAIMLISTLFPDVNTLLSLVAGSICGVFLIVLPVFFYRAAYIDRPSKKSRKCQVFMGYILVSICLPLGMLGVYMNMREIMIGGEPGEKVSLEFA